MKTQEFDEIGERPLWELIDWKPLFCSTRAALLVVDPQNDILTKEGNMSYYGVWKRAPQSISAIKRSVAAARHAGVPIFWIKYFKRADGQDLVPGVLSTARSLELKKKIPGILTPGSWDVEIVDELKSLMESTDYFIDKSASSSFEGTDLEKTLRLLGVRDILVCGYLTDFCVANTARSAYDKGYGTIIIGDACDTRDRGFHEQTLDQHRWYFGPVIDSVELGELLKGCTKFESKN
jgi:ureidoacrylate peracid hydrolase